jgi:hypothetical protein
MRIGPDIPEVSKYYNEFLAFEQKLEQGEKKQATALLTDPNLFANAADLVSDSAYRSQIAAGTANRLAAFFSPVDSGAILAN